MIARAALLVLTPLACEPGALEPLDGAATDDGLAPPRRAYPNKRYWSVLYRHDEQGQLIERCNLEDPNSEIWPRVMDVETSPRGEVFVLLSERNADLDLHGSSIIQVRPLK